MNRFRSMARSIVGVFLVAIATLLVSCSSSSQVAPPPTYTSAQLSQVENYASRIQGSKDRLPELVGYINDEDWANIDNFIHGPLGELRPQMNRLAYALLPDDKKSALKLADDISRDLESLSSAVDAFDSDRATSAYVSFARDLSALLNIVPAEAAPNQADSYTAAGV